jgi:Fe-S-cluster containining protein
MDSAFIPISSLHDRAAQWFDRSRAALLGALPCGQGCSRCCIGPFAITVLDVGILRDGMAALAPAVRDEIVSRAETQTKAMEAEFPRLADSKMLGDWPDSDMDALAGRFAETPCPALNSAGSCRIYAHRPLICRTMGIPTEGAGTVVEGACEIQNAVPVVRLPGTLRRQEDRLAEAEASEFDVVRKAHGIEGDEVWLPYGFLSYPLHPPAPDAISPAHPEAVSHPPGSRPAKTGRSTRGTASFPVSPARPESAEPGSAPGGRVPSRRLDRSEAIG